MNAGAIAFTAIIVSGAEGLALVGAFTWLVHHKRILLAATPKPQAQQQTGDVKAKPDAKTGPVPLEVAS